MAESVQGSSADRFRSEAQEVRDHADWQIFALLCSATIVVSMLFAIAILLRGTASIFLWPNLLGLVLSVAAAWWTRRTRRIDVGIGVQATAMLIGVAGVVLVQRGVNAPALVYGLTTVAVVFVAGYGRLGTTLAVALTLWTVVVTWAAQTGLLTLAAQNPLGVENARLLALFVALLLIGLASRVVQRRRQGLDSLLERSLRLTEIERDEAKGLAERRARTVVEIGHEIRTPMTGIVGVAQLLSQRPLSPLQRRLLSIQRQSAERLLQLVNAVLDQARLDAGPSIPALAPFAPRLVAAEVTELFAPRAQRKGVEIIWVAEPDLPISVQGDSVRVRQILSNLVSNAVKFTDHGAVQVHLIDHAPGRMRIEVRDSGRGIAPDRINDCFERYVSDADGDERSNSTGLGLPISREMARSMGGELSAHSQPGVGSCFVLDLPVGAAPHERGKEQAPGPAIHGRLWVVGASDPLGLQLRCLLGEFDLDLRFVDQPPDLEQWAEEPARPQALMVDGWLGHGRCADALPDILAQARRRGERVIVVSSVAQDAADAGLDDAWQVFRPVSRDALCEALAWALDAPASSAAARPRSSRPLRVLLVDDDAVNQVVGQAILEELGSVVQVVQSGQAALDIVVSQPFDLVLMDLQMPDMDGIEATRRLRALERARGGPRMSVVAVSGQSDIDDKAAFRAAGFDLLLPKPYTIEQLRKVLAAQSLQTAA